MISISVLHQLGYRVCHAANIGNASALLKRIRSGEQVSTKQLDDAISALQHAPLSRSTLLQIEDSSEE